VTEAYFASRAMQALEVLAFGPSTTTRVADALRVHPRTARRLLNRMVHDGWMIRHDGPRPTYTPTLRIVALAAQLAHRTPLVRHAFDLMGDLGLAPGEAVHLVVPSYRSTLRLVRASDADVRALRDLAPAPATAGGKLLLAFRDPWADAVLDGLAGDRVALRAELRRTRARGWAVENQEHRAGVRALAVPVPAEDDDVIAALALSMADTPIDALTSREPALTALASELSNRLGRDRA
jgi:DNA-binding IclR family transcriptional regulator